MTCERYWREGIVLVERGELDPHRDTCADCRREHAARQELVRAIPMIGRGRDRDSNWQARVWQQIARESMAPVRRLRLRRLWWSAGGALAAACAVMVALRVFYPETEPVGSAPVVARMTARPPDDTLPRIEIISGPVAMRSTSARIGDRVRISARSGDDIRVYRADHLVLRCTAAALSGVCDLTAEGLVAETVLATAGEYQVVVIKAMVVEPAGTLSTDLGAVVTVGGDYQLNELSIR